MTPLRWTTAAVKDLYSIARYIRRDNPAAAHRVSRAIVAGCESLIESPYRGRKGEEAGTRELVLVGLPYVVVYHIVHETVEILHIWHGAQDR